MTPIYKRYMHMTDATTVLLVGCSRCRTLTVLSSADDRVRMVAAALAAHAGAGTVAAGGGRRWHATSSNRRLSDKPARADRSVNLTGETVFVEEWNPDGTATVKYQRELDRDPAAR
jgi:hypothetical protein